MSAYQTYRGLPALAGVCSMEQAMKPGLSVEECVRRLKRYHYAFKRLHQIFTARITAEPLYELKMGFSLHAHLVRRTRRLPCASASAKCASRRWAWKSCPTPTWRFSSMKFSAAPATAELLAGLYEQSLARAQRPPSKRHIADTNPLADRPIRPPLPFCPAGIGRHAPVRRARRSRRWWTDAGRERLAPWLQLLDDCLAAAGGPGRRRHARRQGDCRAIIPPSLTNSTVFPGATRAFPIPTTWASTPRSFFTTRQFPPEPKTLMMFYKRLREIDVPEMMASIIAETPGKPWGYYRDMTRQLWDEARHAMMGEVGFASLGIDWPKQVMINFTWSLA